MRKIIALTAIMATAACTPEPMELSADDEGRLAAALDGYEQTGPAESCVNLRTLRGNRSAGEGAIIFEGQGDRVWVNRPPAGCPALTYSRTLQTKTTTNQLCRGDIATVFDAVTGVHFGSCGLGEFTPYRRRQG
ncbi:MAG TPA: hypothetical protein VF759_17320 [Allosphingosinicella sp.]|jgi:hypothetical protein